MAYYRKKPVVIEAITFDELVEHGRANEVSIGNSGGGGFGGTGMPYAFDYKGQRITHETDDCYLVPTLEGVMQLRRGEMLITGVKGEVYPCKADIFRATYDPFHPESV